MSATGARVASIRSCRATMLAVVVALGCLGAPGAAEPLKPAATPPAPRFDRLHDFDEVTALLKSYAAAYPGWVKLESLGKSTQGRDIWAVTLSNPKTGPALSKPAMYVDGNTHGNEVQGGDAVVYTLDFLLRNYGRLDRVTELLDRAVFYLVPVVNPDSRAAWFGAPANADYPRTLWTPVDDDRDGKVDEDGYDDLDGDGVITQMRKHVPMGEGTHRLNAKDPRLLVPVEKDEAGDYIELGVEGLDNDGDGRLNEDGPGYVDPNRTWGYGWQPRYVQNGAPLYPLATPETRSIAVWALTRTNIAALQSFHNSGGMILRIPGAKSHPRLQPEDKKAYDLIGEEGERMLPGYRYIISWKDLYTTYGSTDDHFYRIHGALGFTNEMNMEPSDLDRDGNITDEERMEFNDVLTLGRQFIPWKSFQHPQYGAIEIGGYRHDVGRVPEGWMLEEEIHRNGSFVLLHAYHLPKIRFGEATTKRLEKDLWRLEIPVVNERAIPTMLAVARREKLHREDLATLEGAKVVASGLVEDPWLDHVELQKHRPERLLVPGVDGLSSRTLFFLLEGQGEVTVRYDSVKAGAIETRVRLE